ncbi:DUF2610 domain-containing protein [Jiella endophytica]|uniref:DUF2610 domain-containing protein n=1 Tax=Jiella endophytica TaxID=2558362 RepID=A0A4Y8RUF4_9HYPH|nr:DUF2610 domain-containing protein [Jiella endophytica]TFF27392.1 DUF2610 domain-containing protein [Jiella endophytica]
MKLVAALVTLLMASLFASSSFAEKRIALVIGNDAYQHLRQDNQLERAGQDARSIGNVLEGMGFTVLRGTNLPRTQMLRMIRQLREEVEPGDIALFFFAGHGVAIDGTNYLLPTDIRPAGEKRITEAAIPETRIEGDLLDAGARTAILILDACRDNPFPQVAQRSTGRARGLDASRPTPGIFKMFSAGTGQAAIEQLGDGDHDPNSLFTRVLLGELPKPNQSLIDITYAVKRRVLALSDHRQNPAYYDGGFANDVYLAGRPPEEPAAAQPVEPEKPSCAGASAHFAVAQKLGTREALEAHLSFYGHCPYAPFARALLDGMGEEDAPQVVLSAPPKVEGAAAMAELRKAVQACDRLAASEADRMRPRGVSGVPFDKIDAKSAVPACRQAVEARPDDARMHFQLGRALKASGGSLNDVVASYQRASELGSPLADASLGSMYVAGNGVQRDYARALALFRSAADHELPVAQHNLGSMYEKGLGVDRDFAEALVWYERAAESGHRAAHGAAARILTGPGYGKIGHYARAAEHWRAATEAGDADAALKLAIAIRDGQVEPRSPEEMMESFDAAARTGRADALVALAQIHYERRHYRDALDLAYRAYDIASGAGIDTENGWLPLQFLSASLVVKVVRQARMLPRSQAEYEMFRQDYPAEGFRRFTIRVTCGEAEIPFSLYAWNWTRDHDMVNPQLEWLEKARHCKVPADIGKNFSSAFAAARKRDVGFAELIVTTLKGARKETADLAGDTP